MNSRLPGYADVDRKSPRCAGCKLLPGSAETLLADVLMYKTQMDREEGSSSDDPITAQDIYRDCGELSTIAREWAGDAPTSLVRSGAKLALSALESADADLEAIAACATNRLLGKCVEYFPIPHPPNYSMLPKK